MERQMVVGFSAPALDLLTDTLSLEKYLGLSPNRSMFLEMEGDAMLDANIAPGDIVIVERTTQAKPGQIVATAIDGKYVIRYLARDRMGNYLVAANANLQPLRPTSSLTVVGVVVGLIRKVLNALGGNKKAVRQ